MKRISLTLLMFVMVCISMAMITDYYSPPVASTGTYTAITGITPGLSGAGYPPDEEITVAIPLGFTFSYCGNAYTEVQMSTNGYVVMGSTHVFEYTYENMLSSTNSLNYPVLAPIWDDLSSEYMSYLTTGTAPNRIFTAQWQNSMWDYGGNPGQNFQVKLYETSDKIEFIYGPLITPSWPSATIGINMAPGGAGNFFSITPGTPISYSTTVENSGIDTIANLSPGTTYTFNRAMASVPNPALAVFPLPSATSVILSSNLIWASGGGIPTGYRLNFGTNGAGITPPTSIVNNMDLGNNTTYNPTNDLSINTVYYWQVVPYNASGSATGCPIWSFTTGGLPLRGEMTINPSGSGPENYVSFTAAINALNAAGVGMGGVNFNVPAGLTFNETAILPEIAIGGTVDNPVSFRKMGAGPNPLVTVPGTAGNSDYIFKFAGVNYVTIDGIDVANAGTETSVEYGYLLTDTVMAGGSSNNKIKNSVITLSRDNSYTSGIYSVANGSSNSSNLYQNVTVNSAYNGIWLFGMEFSPDENSVIEGCVFNSIGENNMYLQYQSGMNVFDNVVNYPTSEPYASTVYGFNSYGLSTSTIYNNTFSGGNLSRTVYSIFLNEPAEIEIHHNTMSGTVSTGMQYMGVYASSPRWGLINIHHNDIHDITSSMMVWTIYTMRAYDININDNHIYNITTGSIFWGLHIIENMSLDTPSNIYNNKIHNILLTGETFQMVSGINVQDRYANIFNNMVYDIKAPNTGYVTTDPQVCGISLLDMQPAQGERAYVYNNSVLLTATGSSNSSSASFYSTFGGPVDMKNNIFINNSVPGANGKAVAFWKRGISFDNFVATMDKNIYYAGTPGPNNLVYYDGINSCQTLAEYKTLNVGKDQNSYYENVPFLSSVAPFNLHINPAVGTNVESNGIYLSTIVIDDIDGDIRSLTPDIGADEGDFSTFSFLASPANVTISRSGANVQITWNAVAGATGYRVYGSNDAYAATPWGSPLQTVLAPNNSANVSPATQYKFYYVTAYQ